MSEAERLYLGAQLREFRALHGYSTPQPQSANQPVIPLTTNPFQLLSTMGNNNTLADKVAGDVLMKGVRDMILDERQSIPSNFDPSQVAAIRLQAKKN